MKYINKIIIVLGAMFLIKRMFFNNIYLGFINEHYGIVAVLLLIFLIISEIYLHKQNRKK
jgi:hypothetical protein